VLSRPVAAAVASARRHAAGAPQSCGKGTSPPARILNFGPLVSLPRRPPIFENRSCRPRLHRGGGDSNFGGDQTAKLIIAPGLQAATCTARFFEAHAAGSLARSIIRSSARTGTRNSRPILIVGISPRAAAS